MTKFLYTAEQSIRIDRKVVDGDEGKGYALMVRAGERAFSHIQQRFADLHPVVIACGSGNNGGDGYVVARCLQQIGADVLVVQAAAPDTHSCRKSWGDYMDIGGRVSEQLAVIDNAGLLIDAMLGAGLTRAPVGAYGEIIDRFNVREVPRVAIDIPSGLQGDTGAAFDKVIKATLTVTFIVPKVGLYTGRGRGVCGEIVVEALGVDPRVVQTETPIAGLLERPLFHARPIDSHKGMFGRVTIFGGTKGMLGASLLAGQAALRSGAGTVTIACNPDVVDLPALMQPELMTRGVDGVESITALADQSDIMVVGPGTDQAQWSRVLVESALATGKPSVIDAGALRLIAAAGATQPGSVLTPHPGEAAALLGCSTAEIQDDRLSAARQISRRYHAVCVLKGAGTIVTDGDQFSVCAGGNPGMASAGMGDVLSGIIGAFIGQGMTDYEAACAGVYVHSRAADEQALVKGEISLIASDLIEGIAPVLTDCLR